MREILNVVNWEIVAPLLVIQRILLVITLVDWVRTEETNGPKWTLQD